MKFGISHHRLIYNNNSLIYNVDNASTRYVDIPMQNRHVADVCPMQYLFQKKNSLKKYSIDECVCI